MRAAPPVQAWSCSAGSWQSVQQALYGVTAAVAGYWAGAQLWGQDTRVALGAFGLGIAAAAIAGRALAAPSMRLAWDGAVWLLQPAGGEPVSGRVTLMLDLGAWMLVRFTPGEAGATAWCGARWLPLSRGNSAAVWQALRVALHAPQPMRRAA